jgi:phosphoglycolate phosphatase/putative hydrolase of the HAD superfamily
VWKVLRAFRLVREELRQLGAPTASLTELQYVETAKRVGIEPTSVEQIVVEWIFQRPLKYLRFCRRRGLESFCGFLSSRNIPIGVFSDYPAYEKLQVLGLADNTGLTLCATDSAINAFKPHSKGFLHACAVWGLPPEEVLYVGDRFEVDAVGAVTAGMPCAILSKKGRARVRHDLRNCFTISSFPELQYELSNNFKR